MSPEAYKSRNAETQPEQRSWWKRGYDRFLRIRGHPREIALGLALGLFVAMTPTMGFQMVIAIFFAGMFKWNKLAATLGVWVTNPLTAPFIYGMTYLIGSSFIYVPITHTVPGELDASKIYLLLSKTPEIMWALTIGGVITGLPLAVIGYFFAFSTVEKYQRDIREKLARQKSIRARRKARRRDRRKARRAAGGPRDSGGKKVGQEASPQTRGRRG